MYKSERHFDKKKNGQHNFFGEDDYVEIKEGTIAGINTINDEFLEEEKNVTEEEGDG